MATLFSFWLIQPVLSANPQPELHECCRKAGKHHCDSKRGSADGPAFNQAPCQMYQWHGSAISSPAFDLTATADFHFALAAAPVRLNAQSSPDFAAIRTLQSRGPPTL